MFPLLPAQEAWWSGRARLSVFGEPSLYSRIWPWPRTMNLVVVSSLRPVGPKAWSLLVLIPISASRPNS